MPLSQEAAIWTPRGGLRDLSDVVLNARHQEMLEWAAQESRGAAVWRSRKIAEFRALLALSELAPPGRLEISGCEIQDDLRITCVLKTPVPCRRANEKLKVRDSALIGLMYPEDVLRGPLPGIGAVFIIAPDDVFHANVADTARIQPLCLGPVLPRGVRCTDLIIATYGALSLQTVMIDERDPAGVMNPEAARWWQRNRDRIPLSRTPFLYADEPGHQRPALQTEGPPHVE